MGTFWFETYRSWLLANYIFLPPQSKLDAICLRYMMRYINVFFFKKKKQLDVYLYESVIVTLINLNRLTIYLVNKLTTLNEIAEPGWKFKDHKVLSKTNYQSFSIEVEFHDQITLLTLIHWLRDHMKVTPSHFDYKITFIYSFNWFGLPGLTKWGDHRHESMLLEQSNHPHPPSWGVRALDWDSKSNHLHQLARWT